VLAQRIVTAVVLLALLLPAMWAARPEPFLLFTLLFVAAGAWEWGRLNGLGATAAFTLAGALVLMGVYSWHRGWTSGLPAAAWAGLAAMWVAAGSIALARGVQGWRAVPRPGRWLLGVTILWAAWLAIVNARALGLNFLLSVLCLVWIADTAAYFGGHRFGRRKLAPRISPGKTWEGAASGAVAVGLLAMLWLACIDRLLPVDGPSVYARLLEELGIAGLVLGCAFLCAMSVVGDLFESEVKRAAGAKDSSRLLPGHGGVLDRVDALLPVFPIAMALVSWQGGKA
jgi:phosphatidate cytidylyltransferase